MLVLFVVLALSYVAFLPSFEGPDESEHLRYIQAWAQGEAVHPVDPQDRLRWGYQVHHPPLYYAIAGGLARLLGVTFHQDLMIDPLQNPRYPFLRHDLSGQRFPYDAVNRGVHALRLVSVLLGVLTFLVLQRGFRMLFPDEPASRMFLLAASMLAPNTLQIFAIVGNDALNMLFSAATLVLAIAIVRDPGPGPGVFLLAGCCAGLAALSKLTGLAALGVAGTLWAIDGLANGRVATYARGMLRFVPALLLVAGPYFAANQAWYGDPTRESLLRQLTPAFHLDAPRPVSMVLGIIGVHLPYAFAADLGWQSIRLWGPGSWLCFWSWLFCVGASGMIAWRGRGDARRLPAELLVPVLAVGWGLILLVSANREWGNLQVRHVWCLYPFTLIGIVLVLQTLPSPVRAWGRSAAAAGLAGAVLLNLHLLTLFQAFFEPGDDRNRMNRDYYTFLYTQVRDQDRAERYLRYGR